MFTVVLLIILSPAILIAGFISFCILWAILDFFISTIIKGAKNTANTLRDLTDKKE